MSPVPRVLITGFPPFPGAPVNPTQWLIETLQPADLNHVCELRSAIVPVDYAKVGDALNMLASEFDPHIVINFGLAAEAKGIRLERVARNEIAPNRVDNSGESPTRKTICDGEEELASGLPLETIADELERHNISVQWSDDAGGYLCNYIFYLGRAGLCQALNAQMTGFIHVPLFANEHGTNDLGQHFITKDELLQAAKIVIEKSVSHWALQQADQTTV